MKLEREIAKRERQIAREHRNLEEMEGDAAIKAIIRKVAEMEQDLENLRLELVADRRRNHSPPVKRVKEKDVLAELNRLRYLLLSDAGTAAPVVRALVGDVVVEARPVEGQAKPQMVARFTIARGRRSRRRGEEKRLARMIQPPTFGSRRNGHLHRGSELQVDRVADRREVRRPEPQDVGPAGDDVDRRGARIAVTRLELQ